MRRQLFNFYKTFPYFAPYWAQKGPAPLFEKIWITIPQACLSPSLVEIGEVVLEKKLFKGKG